MADNFQLDFLAVEAKKSGDAISIRYEVGGKTYIHVIDGGYVDTGESLRNHIIAYYGNPAHIDNVIVTHNDGDHACGLIPILEHFGVGALWMLRPWLYAEELLPSFKRYTNVDNLRKVLRAAYSNLAALEELAESKGIPIYEPFQGASIGVFRVMAPTRARFLELVITSNKTPEERAQDTSLSEMFSAFVEKAKNAVSLIIAGWGVESFPAEGTSNENEMSVVQYAQIDGENILLTGDTGRNGLAEVIAYAPYVGLILPGINRFQVPHHGGRRNVNTELLDSLLGERLAEPLAAGNFYAYVSSAKADEDHPRKVVERAVIHRGGSLFKTEGTTICAKSHNAARRDGWGTLTPVSYPTVLESDD